MIKTLEGFIAKSEECSMIRHTQHAFK